MNKMSDELNEYDSYFDDATTSAPILLKTKKKEDKKSYLDIDIDTEKYEKTKVKRKTLRYVPKQD